jgi:hypothetical protein
VRVDAVTEYAMQTLDGVWRVEVVKRRRTRWYRIVQDGNQLDGLSIARSTGSWVRLASTWPT